MFKIGEFSRIARVTTRQLRYYDEYGLLHPARIDHESGYRYYSVSQLPRLNRILALKELGLSLDQITRLLDDAVSADELNGMLAMKKAQLEQTVQEELLQIQQIAYRIEQVREDGSLKDYDVVVQDIPETKILSIRTQIESLSDGMEMMYEINHLLPMRAGREALGSLMIVMHTDEFRTDKLEVEIGFQVKHAIVDGIQLSNGLQLSLSSLPPVTQMATLVREGLFADHVHCFASLGRWIENNGYEIAGSGREVMMNPLIRGQEDHLIIESQIPVRRLDMAM